MSARSSASPPHSSSRLCGTASCIVCNSVACMECVACLRDNEISSVFCGPDCFKAHWTQHRLLASGQSPPVQRARAGVNSPQPYAQPAEWSTPTKLAPRTQYPQCHFEAAQGLTQGAYRPTARRQLEVGVGYRMR